jgi:hypothetical protein
MSSLTILGDTSGSVILQAPAVSGSTTITLPATTGTAALTNQVIGVGQTWQNVTASRAIGTTYTNSTGKPIEVIVACTGNGVNGLFGVTLNGVVTVYSPSTYSASVWTSMSFIVPDGNTYVLSQQGSNVTLQAWAELR